MERTSINGLWRINVLEAKTIRRALCVLYAHSTDQRERDKARAMLDKMDKANDKR